MNSSKVLLVMAALVGSAILAGCAGGNGGTTTPACTTNCEVTMNVTTFTPATLKVKAGSTVVWENNSGTVHNVLAVANAWPMAENSGDVQNGQTFSKMFSKAGTYKYYCSYHATSDGASGMIGTIEVVA